MDELMVGFWLTNRDKILIEWLNMLTEAGLSPRTWVQAALLSEVVGEPLDIGGVYIPSKNTQRKTRSSSSIMLGDDTEDDYSESFSKNRKYAAGDKFILKITRPAVLEAIMSVQRRNKKVTTYIKAIIRRKIRVLESGPNQPPSEEGLSDIFVLYQDFFDDQENHAPVQKENREKKPAKAVSEEESLPKPSRTKKPSREEPPQISQPQPVSQQPDSPPKRKNPLLEYIK